MIDNILAITGGMGTGKSTVLSLFEKNGFNVVNSDQEVAALFSSEYKNYISLANDFDNWLKTDFTKQSCIDKKILRKYIETSEDGFKKSMDIVKPYISERLLELAQTYSGKKVVFEIPVLFEAKMESYYKNILVVTAPLDIRLKRIQLRQPHLSLAQIQQTIDSQLPEVIKIKKANFVLDNSGTLEQLEHEFNNILPEILNIYTPAKLKPKY